MSFQEALEYIDILSDDRFSWINCYDTCVTLAMIDSALAPVLIERAGVNLHDLHEFELEHITNGYAPGCQIDKPLPITINTLRHMARCDNLEAYTIIREKYANP